MAARFLANCALFIAIASFMASATDPNQLNNFCVAAKEITATVLVNGQLCKNPSDVTVDDFLFRGMNIATNTNNYLGVNTIYVDPTNLPGLNTLGLSLIRADFAPSGGLAPPHTHTLASEVLMLLEGSLHVGFVSYNQSNNSAKLYSTVLSPGDVFVFPQGHVHFAFNVGETNAVAIAALSSQSASTNMVPTVLFGTHPPISVDVLSKAFKLDPKIVEDLQSKF